MFRQTLLGGFNHLEKYESQWEGLSHILWKIKVMFETTNKLSYVLLVSPVRLLKTPRLCHFASQLTTDPATLAGNAMFL